VFNSTNKRPSLGGARNGNTSKPREPRVQITKSASICIEETGQVIPCTLRDITSRGARMSVASHGGIPDIFVLKSRQEGINTRVRVAWRRQYELGVSFLSR